VRSCQRRQRLGRARSLQHRVAERARQRVEHRRPQHELELARRQAAEDLVAQVVRDESILAAEPVRRRRAGAAVAERQRREGQPRRPSLGPAQQGLRSVAIEPESREPEEQGGLAPGHGEVARSELRHEPLLTETSDRKGGPASGRQGQSDFWPEVVDDAAQRVQRRGPVEQVQIVQDKDQATGSARVMERCERAGDSCRQAGAVVVAFVDGDPREGPGIVLGPLAEQRGLAVAGGRQQDGQRRRTWIL
jgi:hypothetical protein